MKKFVAWPALLFVFCLVSCQRDSRHFRAQDARYAVRWVGQLPPEVDESSGLALAADTNTLWTLNDGGGQTALYGVSRTGQLRARLLVAGTRNHDWEDLAKDPRGNLYVGDFGNNFGWRDNLRIYRVRLAHPRAVDSLGFAYADPTAPGKTTTSLNCEGFFYFRDSLYLFPKISQPGSQGVFALPARPGNFVARPVAQVSLPLTTNGEVQQVTAADVSPDGRTFALLTYGDLFVFGIRDGRINFSSLHHRLTLDGDAVKQVEALVFINNTDLVISNEQGDVFEVRQRKVP